MDKKKRNSKGHSFNKHVLNALRTGIEEVVKES